MTAWASWFFRAWDNAIEFFRSKIVLTSSEFDSIRVRARSRAFRVAGISQLRIVQDVFDDLDRALLAGRGLADFKRRTRAKLYKAWGKSKPWHLETIYRTNLQTSYSAARYRAATKPTLRITRPFWMFDAVLDGDTTPGCKRRNRKILRNDHPFWETNYPPLHFNCRSSVRTLGKTKAARRGITSDAEIAELLADPKNANGAGFGAAPRVDGAASEGDLSRVDPALRDLFERRQQRIKIGA